jgi:hypothetical protein
MVDINRLAIRRAEAYKLVEAELPNLGNTDEERLKWVAAISRTGTGPSVHEPLENLVYTSLVTAALVEEIVSLRGRIEELEANGKQTKAGKAGK